ncbi:hypothetical protein GF391_03550 [Candidatus Uhrbacteria bacterium]|nr:hypothetical protein [Candidatus Uhrbacteria bacterium]
MLQQIIREVPEEMTREQCLALIEQVKQEQIDRLREQEQRDVSQYFPNLLFYPDDPQLDDEEKFWQRFKYLRRSSVLVGEKKRFRNLKNKLAEAKAQVDKNQSPAQYRNQVAEAQDRALYEFYTDKYNLDRLGFKQARALMQIAITNVQTALNEILKEYFPSNRRRQLEYAASVQAAYTMPQLIELMSRNYGNGVISRRIPFEARIIAVLAQLEFESLIGSHNPEQLEHARQELIARLENHVFDDSLSERVVVVAKLDPANNYRVKTDIDGRYQVEWYYENQPDAEITTNETTYVLPLDVRVVKRNGRQIFVYFESRPKQRIFTKQLRKKQRKPEQITDLSAMSIVLLNCDRADEEHLANMLRATVVNCPGLVSAQQSNASRAGAIDPGNPFSSGNRRGEKYELLWGGFWHELQILSLPDFINSLVAHAQDGHPFYKLITYLDTLFPWIWPPALYGLNWYDQEVRDMLWRRQCRSEQPA